MPNYMRYSQAFDDPYPYSTSVQRAQKPSREDAAVPDPPGTDIKSHRRTGDAERERYCRHLEWCASLGLIDDDELEARKDAAATADDPRVLARLVRDLPPLREDDYTPEGMRITTWKNRFQGDPMKRPWRHFAHFLAGVAAALLIIVSAVTLGSVKHPHTVLTVFCSIGIVLGSLTFIASTAWWIAWMDYARTAARRAEVSY